MTGALANHLRSVSEVYLIQWVFHIPKADQQCMRNRLRLLLNQTSLFVNQTYYFIAILLAHTPKSLKFTTSLYLLLLVYWLLDWRPVLLLLFFVLLLYLAICFLFLRITTFSLLPSILTVLVKHIQLILFAPVYLLLFRNQNFGLKPSIWLVNLKFYGNLLLA